MDIFSWICSEVIFYTNITKHKGVFNCPLLCVKICNSYFFIRKVDIRAVSCNCISNGMNLSI